MYIKKMEEDIIYEKLSKIYIIDKLMYINYTDIEKENFFKYLCVNRMEIIFKTIYCNTPVNGCFIDMYISQQLNNKYNIQKLDNVDYLIAQVKKYSIMDKFPNIDIEVYKPLNGWLSTLHERNIYNYLGSKSKRKIRYAKLLEVYVYLLCNIYKYSSFDILTSPLYPLLVDQINENNF